MKAFVITIIDNEKSVEQSNRCIESCKKYGLGVEKFPAITPRHKDFYDLVKKHKLVVNNFENKWSRSENAMALFLSMTHLWEYSVDNSEDVLILEHDAVMTGPLPPTLPFDKCMTLGKPSYGKFNTPTKLGVGPLVQKQYFGGAHAYVVSPKGASELIRGIPTHSMPADVYLNTTHFPWLQEYYPWVFEARDSFSTIQKEEGCIAKHNYGKGIEIVRP